MFLGAELWGKTAAELAVHEVAEAGGPYVKRMYRWLRANRRRVVLLGMAGSGKTALADHLTAKGKGFQFGYQRPGQSIAVDKRRHLLPKVHLTTIDVPGQPSGTREDALAEWGRKKVHGVIHLMANGYRTRRDTTTLEGDISKAGSIEQYLKNERDVEVAAFRLDFGFYRELFRNHRTRWILVAVSKADLYWNEHNEAGAFYSSENSTFGRALTDLRTAIGADNVSIYVVPVSTKIEELDLNGHKIKPQLESEARDGLLVEFHRVLQQLGTLR